MEGKYLWSVHGRALGVVCSAAAGLTAGTITWFPYCASDNAMQTTVHFHAARHVHVCFCQWNGNIGPRQGISVGSPATVASDPPKQLNGHGLPYCTHTKGMESTARFHVSRHGNVFSRQWNEFIWGHG